VKGYIINKIRIYAYILCQLSNVEHENLIELLYLKHDVNLVYFTVPSMIPLPNEIPLPSSQDKLPHGILKKTSGFR